MQEIGCLAGYTTKNTQICLTALCEIRGWNMDRILTYQIGPSEGGLRIEQFLRRRGYSLQNLTQLKKMKESVLVNGQWLHLNRRLTSGDELVIHIQEHESSKHIPAVNLPLDIVYEDEDIIDINKPAGMPSIPPRIITGILLPMLSHGIIKNRERLSYSGVPTGWTGILPVLPLSQSIC